MIRLDIMVEVSKTDKISATFSVEYLDNGVIVYRLTSGDRATIDTLIEVGERHADEYRQSQKHLRRIIDLSKGGMPNPYAMAKARHFLQKDEQKLRYSTATLISPKNFAMALAKTALGLMSGSVKASVRIFTDEAEALAWLETRHEALGE